MVQLNFNAGAHQARYGSDGGGLPAGKHKVIIEDASLVPTKDNSGNNYLQLVLKCVEGLAQGGTQKDRLNLYHNDQKTVAIAQGQLAAYCWVVGKPGFNDTSELYNIPFYIEVGPQSNNPQYTEVKKLFNLAGEEPGKGGQAQVGAAPQQQPQGFGPVGGAPPQQGWGQPAAQPQTNAGWGQPQPGPQPQSEPQPQAAAQQGWGANQAAPQQGWAPQGGQTAPSWGAR